MILVLKIQGTVSTHMNKEYKEENVENERKKVQAQLPKLKNSPLVLKDLTKVKSRSDHHCLELYPCRECTGSVANRGTCLGSVYFLVK